SPPSPACARPTAPSVEPVIVGFGTMPGCGFERDEALLVVADLDELGADAGHAGQGAIARDRVLKGQRLNGCGLEEGLVVLDRPQPLETEDRADRLLLSAM